MCHLQVPCRAHGSQNVRAHPLDDLPAELTDRRLLPSAGKDMVLPLAKPLVGNDGTEMGEIVVPAGTTIAVSILRANRDPGVWGPDADVWKPERYVIEYRGLPCV